MKTLFKLLLLSPLAFAQNFYYEFGQKVEVKKKELKLQSKANSDILEYENSKGQTIRFKNEIIVVCKDSSCINDINNYNYKKLSSNFYLIKPKKDENIFKLCQDLYNKESINTATPNFVKTRNKR